MNTEKKTIGIIGAGPTGSILAAYLSNSNFNINIIARGKRYQQIKNDGIIINGFTQKQFSPDRLLNSLDELKKHPVDYLLICTKTFALESILKDLKGKIKRETLLISCQNGINPEDEIGKVFPNHKVARMVVNFAGNINPDNGHVSMSWFRPPNFLGSFQKDGNADLDLIALNFTNGAMNTEKVSSNNIKERAFLKTMLNASLNPYCAVASLTMKEAMTGGSRPVVCQILHECIAVGQELGYNFQKDIVETCLLDYLAMGKDHYPSMWCDLNAERPTEIDFINGKILELGLKKGLNLPYNTLLCSMIIAKELKMGTRKDNFEPDGLFKNCFEKCGAHTNASEAKKGCLNSIYRIHD